MVMVMVTIRLKINKPAAAIMEIAILQVPLPTVLQAEAMVHKKPRTLLQVKRPAPIAALQPKTLERMPVGKVVVIQGRFVAESPPAVTAPLLVVTRH